MSNPNTFEDYLSDIIYDYFDTFVDTEPVIPEYRFVEDIAREYLALLSRITEVFTVDIESLSTYNGFTIPPKEIGGIFTVLINKKVLIENIENKCMNWIGTIAHETTHVQDFAQYAKMVGAKDYEVILHTNKHGMFNLWTEINARARGYYFTRKYSLGIENLKNESFLSDIMEREIPAQQKILLKQYNSTNDGFKQAYHVAQYIGRLYTLQQLYPNAFNDIWIYNHFGANNWMNDWFLFFKEHNTLKSAFEHFDEMKTILSQNFEIMDHL